ncbi:endonuclease III domain-containing protein [Salidesulfovibrio brasiliensis]|uniref:endonuclease III domain-containing protein n=1 Tax=Salidesulfovibrio brasiliensis TaxID=221711 RepID=UPI0006CFF95F|nr:endonuclease III domain-containing protein [Salidesulfovibrio brasiliensis]
MGSGRRLDAMYRAMLDALGPSHWWPGDSPFEVCVGAILTQNTAWTNVEKAIAALREADVLEPEAMYSLPQERLAECIRPAGYFNIKAARLRSFLKFLKDQTNWDISALESSNTDSLREQLLGIKGIGPETADSMLLYAFNRPMFVVDAYTARIMTRHGMAPEESNYFELQSLFMDSLPEDVPMYNEFHALIVRVGKDWCKKRASQCAGCPLEAFLD